MEVYSEDVLRALQQLNEAIQLKVQDELERWAMEVREYARSLAPVRTGYLRSSIYARVQGWIAEIGAEAPYAIYVEFGTRYMQAQPYLYPALEEFLPRLEEIFLKAIDEAKMEAGL